MALSCSGNLVHLADDPAITVEAQWWAPDVQQHYSKSQLQN